MLDQIRRFQLYGDGLDTYSLDLLHVETIAARAPLHNWFIAPHRHPRIAQLLFLRSGTGMLIAEGEETLLPPPSLVLIPCDCPHAFRFGSDAAGWVLSIADALVLEDRLAFADKVRFMARNAVAALVLDPASSVTDLIAVLFLEISRRQFDARIHLSDTVTAALSLLLGLSEELAAQVEPVHLQAVDSRVGLFRRFMHLVEHNFRSNWRLARFSKEIGCSQATLSRACHSVTGRSPGQLIHDRRMLEARRSLSYTTASVSKVAEELGFDDPAYFARSFRKHAGLSATGYRRRNMQLVRQPALPPTGLA